MATTTSSRRKRVLVSGARDWDDRQRLYDAFSGRSHGHLIVGDCRGVDTLAASVARELGWTVEVHKARWYLYGNYAGPRRNMDMLLREPDEVWAFHDHFEKSKGTKHMVTIAAEAGVPTYLNGVRIH